MSQFFSQSNRQKKSPGRPAFFQSGDTGEEAHLSLQSYISKHIQKNYEAQTAPQSVPGQPVETPQPRPQENRSDGGRGYQLNRLDVELGAGLEQFLPTPITRLRVMKSRLVGEIQDIKTQIVRYEKLRQVEGNHFTVRQSETRLHSLRERLRTLETHEREVTDELSRLLAYGPLMARVIQFFMAHKARIDGTLTDSGERYSPMNLVQPARYEIISLTRQAQSLQNMLAERMRDPAVSGAEIGEIINQYETTLREVDRLRSFSETQKPWWQRLGTLLGKG